MLESFRTALIVLALAACGEVAAPPAADAPPTGCPIGMTECDSLCVDTQSDERYCGDCDTACLTGMTCEAGACMAPCQSQPGFVSCEGSCIDPLRDMVHCGAAGNCMGANTGVTCVTPQTCSNGACMILPKRVFVTSTLQTGALGGAAGADQICQNHADAAGLPGTYFAWIADSAATSPNVRFSRAPVPYIRTDGQPIANDWNDLVDGTLLSPLNLTELGQPAPLPVPQACGLGVERMVWSNVDPFGNWFPGICGEFTTAMLGVPGQWGWPDDVMAWTTWCSGGQCDWLAPIYCFEQ